MISTIRTRRGTTLVELMVAAAMLILGMWLLVWLYQQGMNSFLYAKSQADLTSQERNATTVLQRDLGQQFFLDEDGKPNRGRRLSDQHVYDWSPPRGGYFWARSTPAQNRAFNPINVIEATDGDFFDSSRSVDHALQFTILLPGGSDSGMVGAQVPSALNGQLKVCYGTAAEVTYALVPTGQKTNTGLPLYDLIRRQRLVARSLDDAPLFQMPTNPDNPANDPAAREVMVVSPELAPPNAVMRTLSDLTLPIGYGPAVNGLPIGYTVPNYPAPCRLPQPQWAIQTGARFGEDRLMSNVLSFEVKFTGPPNQSVGTGAWPSDLNSNAWPRPFVSTTGGLNNSDFPYDNLPFNGEFDTLSTRLTPDGQGYFASTTARSLPIKRIRITGVMIRIRAHDFRNQNTRQTTVHSPL